jgi:hypothetical protein
LIKQRKLPLIALALLAATIAFRSIRNLGLGRCILTGTRLKQFELLGQLISGLAE